MGKTKVCWAMLCCFFVLGAFTHARADMISGQVLGPDGKPAPGAQVWLQKLGGISGGIAIVYLSSQLYCGFFGTLLHAGMEP